MYWTYLFVFDDNVGTHKKVQDFIDGCPEIVNWHTYWPNAFLLVSDSTAAILTDVVQKGLNKRKGRFIIVDTAADRSGWLPQAAWKLMREPKPAWDM
jgi:hypothetical protein